MKSIVIILLVALLTISGVMAYCYDNDNGKNPFVSGNVTFTLQNGNTIIKHDTCFVPGEGPKFMCSNLYDPCFLKEYYCSVLGLLRVKVYSVQDCSNGQVW